jgi:hypothetical protein
MCVVMTGFAAMVLNIFLLLMVLCNPADLDHIAS